jgi:hypothetical protein
MRVAHGLGDREAPCREQEVASPQRAKAGGTADAGPQAIRPGPGGVHDRGRADLRRATSGPGNAVRDPDAEYAAVRALQQLLDLSVRQEHGAGRDRVHRHPEDEAGVVGRGVAIAERRDQVRVPNPRREELQLSSPEPPVRPPVGQEVVGRQATLHRHPAR